MLRRITFVLYIVLCASTAYRSVDSIANFFQCEEEFGPLQSVFIWIGLVEKPAPTCPSTIDVFQGVVWNVVFLVMLVVFAEIAVMATKNPVGFKRNQNVKVPREETEALYFMENAMKFNGEIMILRLTKTKRQTFRFDPSTRKFQLILTFLRQQEESEEEGDGC